MIEIDGAHGEGGGQVLRTAVSLSAVLQEPVRVTDIRAKRPNPGLAAQHVAAIGAVAELCDAEVEGVHVGSREMTFLPGTLAGGDFELDIGTAGSTSLVLQACLLPATFSKAPVTLALRGGTDTKWSPPIDFMRLVHIPIIRRIGASCDIDVVRRGFYPEGGGEVVARVDPCPVVRGVDLAQRGELVRISGVTYAQNLPEHVVSRMKHAALKTLVDHGRVKVDSDLRSGSSTGAGIVLAAEYEGAILGASALGQRGVRAETLGENCAADLAETMRSGATVDEHMLDQIVPYMALAEGESTVLAEELTGHAETNIWVVDRFLGQRFATEKKDHLTELRAA
ncbi:MAG: RNA 3'-terminal phosphate cyclase [Thermoplasmata archaeon]